MRYMGSKKRLSKKIWEDICKEVPITEDTYFVDLFCGGCSVVGGVPLKNRIANDLNTPLISYLKKIVEDTNWLPNENFLTKTMYNHIKRNKHLYKPFFLGYVGFNFSYGASYFQGFIGNERNHAITARKSALKDAEKLKGVKFYNMDYKDVPIPPKSIVYCDIPYKGTASYNGNEKGFNYDEFFRYAQKLKDEGHYVFISECTQEVPKDFKLIAKYQRSSNMCNGSKARKGRKFTYEKFKKRKVV